MHRKGCMKPDGEVVVVAIPEHLLPKTTICCSTPMLRTDGPSYASMCRHNRLLTSECKECRQEHHGVLTYRCSICGRQMQDSPHLAQGPEALTINSIAR